MIVDIGPRQRYRAEPSGADLVIHDEDGPCLTVNMERFGTVAELINWLNDFCSSDTTWSVRNDQ